MATQDQKDQQLYRALGQRAAEIRKSRGWTQEKLAEVVGVAAVTISRWETGQRGMTVATLAKLAHVLRVSLGDLLDSNQEVPEVEGDPQELELLVWWRSLDERDRSRIVEITKVMSRG